MEISYSYWGVVIVLTFIGLPFVVRTLQPAPGGPRSPDRRGRRQPGAGRFQTFFRVILPAVLPALLTGFSLAFAAPWANTVRWCSSPARRPGWQIVPMHIITKLEQFDYAGATALGVMMLLASFVLLLTINLLQWWSRRYAKCRTGESVTVVVGVAC